MRLLTTLLVLAVVASVSAKGRGTHQVGQRCRKGYRECAKGLSCLCPQGNRLARKGDAGYCAYDSGNASSQSNKQYGTGRDGAVCYKGYKSCAQGYKCRCPYTGSKLPQRGAPGTCVRQSGFEQQHSQLYNFDQYNGSGHNSFQQQQQHYAQNSQQQYNQQYNGFGQHQQQHYNAYGSGGSY